MAADFERTPRLISAADQYTEQALRIKTTKSGERVVVDRELTIQYIYNLYYWYVDGHSRR